MPRGSQTRHASVAAAAAARSASTDNHHPHPASASSATAGGGGGGVDDDEEEPLLLLRSATAASTLSALREPALPAHEPLLVQMRKTHVADKVGMAYEGTTVTRVTPGQLADASGVRPGMLILSVNGVRVRCAAEVRVAVAAATDVDLRVRAPVSDASPEEAAAARLDTAAEARAAAAQAAEAKASARRAGLRRGVFVPDAACLAAPGGCAFQPAYCHPPRFDRARLVLPAVFAGAFEVCFVVMQLVFYGSDDSSFVASSHALKVLSVAALWALERRSWRLHTEKVAAEALRVARGAAAAGVPPPASGCSGAEAAMAAAWAIVVPSVLCYSAAADYGACQDADGADGRVFAANATSSLLAASRQPGRDVGDPVACPPLVLLGLHAATLLCVCVACLRAAHVVLARLAPVVHVREVEVPAFVVTSAAAAAAVAPVTRGLSLTAVQRRSTHSLHRGDSGGTTHVSDLVVVDLDDEPEASEDRESGGSGSEEKREETNNSEGSEGGERGVGVAAAAQSQQATLAAVLVAGAVSAVAALPSRTPTTPPPPPPQPQPQPLPVPQQPQEAEDTDASGRWRKRGKQAGVGHRWQQMAVPAPSPTSFLRSAERKFQRQLPQQQQYAGAGGYPPRPFPPGRTSPPGLARGFAPPQGHHPPFPPDPYGYEQGGPLPYGGGVPVPLAPLSPLRPFRYSEYSGDGYGYGGRPDYYGSDEGAEEASERRVWALREYEAASLHVATDAASGISGVIRLMEARRRVLGCRR